MKHSSAMGQDIVDELLNLTVVNGFQIEVNRGVSHHFNKFPMQECETQLSHILIFALINRIVDIKQIFIDLITFLFTE